MIVGEQPPKQFQIKTNNKLSAFVIVKCESKHTDFGSIIERFVFYCFHHAKVISVGCFCFRLQCHATTFFMPNAVRFGLRIHCNWLFATWIFDHLVYLWVRRFSSITFFSCLNWTPVIDLGKYPTNISKRNQFNSNWTKYKFTTS